MPAIYIMAAVTLALSLTLWSGLIYLLSGRQRRYFWLLLPGLPLSAIANLLVKRQLMNAMGLAAHVSPGLTLAMLPFWFLVFLLLMGPAVEEAIKLIPLLFRPAWKMVTGKASAFWVGFVLGISFGLGEAAFIAYTVARNPQYIHLPWYAFTGYLNERLMACFAHGVYTAVLVSAISRGPRSALRGYLGASGLHFFVNLPAALYQVGRISIVVETFSMTIAFIVLAIVFERVRRGLSAGEPYETQNEAVYLRP